jgi:hypothetical protein
MIAVDVLAMARAAGVELLIHDGKLAARGPLTPELSDAIRQYKPSLLVLLTGDRQHVGLCDHCGWHVYADNMVRTEAGALLHFPCVELWIRAP